MKITGTNSSIQFDLENGYTLKAEGEILVNRKRMHSSLNYLIPEQFENKPKINTN